MFAVFVTLVSVGNIACSEEARAAMKETTYLHVDGAHLAYRIYIKGDEPQVIKYHALMSKTHRVDLGWAPATISSIKDHHEIFGRLESGTAGSSIDEKVQKARTLIEEEYKRVFPDESLVK